MWQSAEDCRTPPVEDGHFVIRQFSIFFSSQQHYNDQSGKTSRQVESCISIITPRWVLWWYYL